MSATVESPITAILKDPRRELAGTDLRIRLSLGRGLLNEVLAARPRNTPVEELYCDPDPDNQLHLHLGALAPVIGRVRRRITFVPGPAVSFPDQPWLQFDIIDGFKFLDKPLIRLLRRQLEEKLPRGVELTTRYLRLHVPALLTAAGHQRLVPLIGELRVTAANNVLWLEVHLVAEPEKAPQD